MVGLIEPEPSGDDACLVAIETGDGAQPRAARSSLPAPAIARPRWLADARARRAAPCTCSSSTAGRGLDEARLVAALAPAREHVLRIVWLGGYARPLAGAA